MKLMLIEGASSLVMGIVYRLQIAASCCLCTAGQVLEAQLAAVVKSAFCHLCLTHWMQSVKMEFGDHQLDNYSIHYIVPLQQCLF